MSLSFRPLGRSDFPILSDWLARPHVVRWWRDPHDSASLEARYGPGIDGIDPTEVFMVELNREPIGLSQRYRIEDNPSWKQSLLIAGVPGRSAGIDYLIGDEADVGQGLGPRIIDLFVEDTWRRYPDVVVIAVVIQQDNRRSWRAVEKSRFERVWAGQLDSDDPSDEGPSYVYLRRRTLQ